MCVKSVQTVRVKILMNFRLAQYKLVCLLQLARCYLELNDFGCTPRQLVPYNQPPEVPPAPSVHNHPPDDDTVSESVCIHICSVCMCITNICAIRGAISLQFNTACTGLNQTWHCDIHLKWSASLQYSSCVHEASLKLKREGFPK